MKLPDRLTGPVIAALGVAAWWGGSRLPPTPGQQIGPDVFPMVIGLGLILCGAMIFFRLGASFEEEDKLVTAEEAGVPNRAVEPIRWVPFKVLTPPALLFFYAMVVDRIGFWPTAIVMVGAVAMALGSTWRSALVLAALAPPVVHLVFAKLLRVPLPAGLLPFPW